MLDTVVVTGTQGGSSDYFFIEPQFEIGQFGYGSFIGEYDFGTNHHLGGGTCAPSYAIPQNLDQQAGAFVQGLGNSMTFGLADKYYYPFMSKLLFNRKHVPYKGTAKTLGEGSFLVGGTARAGYTAYANTIPRWANSAEEAVQMRNRLKAGFSGLGGRHPRIKSVDQMLSRYGSEQAVINAAGRTNQRVNSFFAAMAAGSALALSTGGNSCE